MKLRPDPIAMASQQREWNNSHRKADTMRDQSEVEGTVSSGAARALLVSGP